MICFVLSCKHIKDWVTKTAFLGKENLAILLFSKENKNWTKDKIVQQHPLKLPFRWAMKTLYPLELQNPRFTVMWGLFWMAKWLKLSAEWIKQLYHVYLIPVWVCIPEWEFWFCTSTGVNSHRYGSHCYEKLCCNHVNRYKETRGNRDELVPELKSYWCHVN